MPVFENKKTAEEYIQGEDVPIMEMTIAEEPEVNTDRTKKKKIPDRWVCEGCESLDFQEVGWYSAFS